MVGLTGASSVFFARRWGRGQLRRQLRLGGLGGLSVGLTELEAPLSSLDPRLLRSSS